MVSMNNRIQILFKISPATSDNNVTPLEKTLSVEVGSSLSFSSSSLDELRSLSCVMSICSKVSSSSPSSSDRLNSSSSPSKECLLA